MHGNRSCVTAGYSKHLEELSDSPIKTRKEVDFFGLINVTRMAVEAIWNQKPSGRWV